MPLSPSFVTPRNIERLVLPLRPDGQRGSFCLGTAERPLSGKQAHIFVLSFHDTTQWAIRVPVHGKHLDSAVLTSLIDTKVDTLQTMQLAGFSWAPKLITFDSGFNNAMRFPCLVLTWISGSPLQWSETIPTKRKHRDKIVSQIMNMTIDLANATSFSELYD